MDFGKIRRRIDFQPRWTVEEGVRQVAQALRDGTVGDYQDPRYSNIKFLSEANGTEVLRYNREFAESLYLLGSEME